MYQFTFPPAVQKGSFFSTPSPTITVCQFFDDAHSRRKHRQNSLWAVFLMVKLMPFCCPKYIHTNLHFLISKVGRLRICCSTICHPFSSSWHLPVFLLALALLLVGPDQSLCVTCHAHSPGLSLAFDCACAVFYSKLSFFM